MKLSWLWAGLGEVEVEELLRVEDSVGDILMAGGEGEEPAAGEAN